MFLIRVIALIARTVIVSRHVYVSLFGRLRLTLLLFLWVKLIVTIKLTTFEIRKFIVKSELVPSLLLLGRMTLSMWLTTTARTFRMIRLVVFVSTATMTCCSR